VFSKFELDGSWRDDRAVKHEGEIAGVEVHGVRVARGLLGGETSGGQDRCRATEHQEPDEKKREMPPLQ
jgi:hypothetical protein